MRELARKYRLKVQRQPDGTLVVPGKRGFLYRHAPDRLGWALVYRNGNGRPTAHLKQAAKKDPKLDLHVEGDEEAIFLFEKGDLVHVAKRWAQCRFRRRVSPGERGRLRALSRRHSPFRKNGEPSVEALPATQGGTSAWKGVLGRPGPKSGPESPDLEISAAASSRQANSQAV